jgi:hypothetical protein
MKMNKKSFGRRVFLGGAGAALGAGLCPPWLESIGQKARAQGIKPTRFVLVSVGHSPHAGSGGQEWIPSSRGALTNLPPLLAPLAAHTNRLTTVEGVDNLVARLVSSNGHNASSRTLFSCMPHAEALNGDGSLRSGAPSLEWSSASGGPSIEYVLADALGTSPLTLRVGGRNGEHRRTFRLDNADDEGDPSPLSAFDRTFGEVESVEPASSPLEQLQRRRDAILGTVRENYARLSNRVSSSDRMRLQAHAGMIEGFIAGLEQTVEVVCEQPSLARDPELGSSWEDGDGRNDEAIAKTMNSLIATVLGCTNTRVVSLHYTNMQSNKFPFLNGGQDLFSTGWHAVCHREAGSDDQRMTAMRWYSTMHAHLLDQLAAVPRGAGSLLDETIVIWTSSLSTHWHGTDGLPVVIASPPGGPIATGQHFGFSGDARYSLADLWVTVQNAMGVPATSFGWNRGSDPQQGRPFNRGPMTDVMT